MAIKVIAIKKGSIYTKIYYLNLLEPKNKQLYMAIYNKTELSILTIFNSLTDQYEEVTSLFPVSFLQNLSEQIFAQINRKSYSIQQKETQLKSIL
ncbi:MAG TPA: hypothetical protein VEY70_22505 [Metabacillus sp.]|nr:hypothetical protein [Metabacillus sp.]